MQSRSRVSPRFLQDTLADRYERVLQGRKLGAPLSFARRFNGSGVIGAIQTFPLFQTEDGYPTIIDSIRLIVNADPFFAGSVIGARLTDNGRPIDGARNAFYNNGDPLLVEGKQYTANGFIPVFVLSLMFDTHFLYRFKPKTQIDLQMVAYEAFDGYSGTVYIEGARLT